MAGRGAQSKSKPTKAEQKKNKSKSKAKDYWVSVFFCVIPYDSLKSYKKGKFKIGSKKFETVCYTQLGKPIQKTGSYKKRKKYDLPLYVKCDDFTIDENGWVDEEDLYSHVVLTLLDFYNATSELLNKDKKLNVHFHIGCDTISEPLRHALRQVLTSDGANDIPKVYKRFAQFSRNYEAFMDRFKEKEWTFKVDYSACYNLFLSFCPGLETEHSPYKKKEKQDKAMEKLQLIPSTDAELEEEQKKTAAAPPKPVAKNDSQEPKKRGQLELLPSSDAELEAEQKKAAAKSQAEQEPAPIKLKDNSDPNKPKPKLKIAGEEQPEKPAAKPGAQDLKLLDSNTKEDKKSDQKQRTQADVDADLRREGKKNPKEKSIRVKDTSGTWVHYRNPYYDGPLEQDDKIQLL